MLNLKHRRSIVAAMVTVALAGFGPIALAARPDTGGSNSNTNTNTNTNTNNNTQNNNQSQSQTTVVNNNSQPGLLDLSDLDLLNICNETSGGGPTGVNCLNSLVDVGGILNGDILNSSTILEGGILNGGVVNGPLLTDDLLGLGVITGDILGGGILNGVLDGPNVIGVVVNDVLNGTLSLGDILSGGDGDSDDGDGGSGCEANFSILSCNGINVLSRIGNIL